MIAIGQNNSLYEILNYGTDEQILAHKEQLTNVLHYYHSLGLDDPDMLDLTIWQLERDKHNLQDENETLSEELDSYIKECHELHNTIEDVHAKVFELLDRIEHDDLDREAIVAELRKI